MNTLAPARQIVCADALVWMASPEAVRGPVVTSLPDAEEVGLEPAAWAGWFQRAAVLAMRLPPAEGAAVFYQTDRKAGGQLWSKAGLLLRAAEQAGVRLLWHKVALRRAVGAVDLHRPGFTHLMAFSAAGRPGAATADVFARGRTAYPNGMGLRAARVAVEFAGRDVGLVVDPFCGRGTVPAVAQALGFRAVGVDIDPAQCEAARKLRLARR